MKILVVCQYYYPEPFRVNDICEEMIRKGHEVTVVTGEPNYPEGYIYKGYEKHNRADEVINGVEVHRCPIIPRKTGSVYRLLNYFSYPFEAKRYIKKLIAAGERPFDVVFVNQLSPVMMAEPAMVYKKIYNIPVVLYCLDLWPESLIAGGIKRKSLIYKLFHRISKNVYRNADTICISSKLFREYLVEQFSVNDKRIKYLPQYAESLFKKLPYKESNNNIDLVFAGNIGEIQSVETIIKAAKKMINKPVHFHIVGGGTDLNRIKEIADGLNNITFYGRKPVEEMIDYYSMADAMLITMCGDPVLSLTLPGKVQSYMAAGKPIIGAIDGETAEVIRNAQCGYCGKADDVEGLVHNIELFMNSTDKEKMGLNARAFYDEYFAKEKFMDKLEKEFKLAKGDKNR